MQHRISHGPVFSILEFELGEAEEVVAQPNSMLSMSTGVELTGAVGKTTDKVGWWGGFKSVLGGESFFRAVFRAKRDGQTLILAPDSYGDILTLDLAEVAGYQLTRGSFLASAGQVEMKVVYGGVKGLLAKTGLFLLRVSGEGTVFCQSFGALLRKDLAEGEQFVIDNRYVVAFSTTVTFQLVKASKRLADSLMSGEALVNKFTGPGRIYYQTRVKPSPSFLGYLLNAST
jgi:uncharacterized protein (TIGR00266 family)